MELVRGIPITEYADENRLSIPARLQLFVHVCHAVQHAHQNGIIHRDLKPSNVLVTLHDGVGVPKVIDFGVAKATNGQLTDKTLFTNFSQIIGTPSYMSPEQAELSGLDVDTRSDIYSLGVLLYELLTGATPFDKTRLREASYDEMRRIIREEEPLTPSAFVDALGEALTGLAHRRRVDPGGFTRLLRGDLDWIVIKTLEKDRGRRYPTANELARDIERYLHDEPVEARPPSAAYRFQKFARRNRVALITTGLVTAALVTGTIVSVWQAVRARQAEAVAEAESNESDVQRRRAEANFQKARQAIDDYVLSIRDSKLLSDPNHHPLRKELIASTLAYYRQFVDQYQDDPAFRPDIGLCYVRIGQITNGIGLKRESCQSFQKAVEVYQSLSQAAPENQHYLLMLGTALNGLASVLHDAKRLEEFAQASQRALPIFERLHHDHPGDAQYAAGLVHAEIHRFQTLNGQGQWAQAEASLRRVLALCEEFDREQHGNRDFRTKFANAHYFLGHLQRATHRPDDAVDSFRLAAQMYDQVVVDFGYRADDRRAAAASYFNLGDECRLLGRNAEAMSAFLAARAAYQDLANQVPPDAAGRTGVGRANFRLGVMQAELGEQAAAQKSWIAAAADFDEAVRQPNPPISALAGLAASSAMQGNWTTAAAAGVKAVEASGRSCDYLADLALLQWAANDESGYRASCAELVSRFGNSASNHEARGIVAACVIGEAAVSDMSAVLAIAERMTASEPGSPIHQALLGAATWRAGQAQHGTAILERALPLCAVAAKAYPTACGQVRAIHLISATLLARAYSETGDQQGLSAEVDSLRELIARYERALPQFDEDSPRWFLVLALDLARRETSRLGDPSAAPAKSAAE